MAVPWYSPSAILTPGGVAAGLSDLGQVIASAPERQANIQRQMEADARAKRQAALEETQLTGVASPGLAGDPGAEALARRIAARQAQEDAEARRRELRFGFETELHPIKRRSLEQEIELRQNADARAGLGQAGEFANTLGIQLPGYDVLAPVAGRRAAMAGIEYNTAQQRENQLRFQNEVERNKAIYGGLYDTMNRTPLQEQLVQKRDAEYDAAMRKREYDMNRMEANTALARARESKLLAEVEQEKMDANLPKDIQAEIRMLLDQRRKAEDRLLQAEVEGRGFMGQSAMGPMIQDEIASIQTYLPQLNQRIQDLREGRGTVNPNARTIAPPPPTAQPAPAGPVKSRVNLQALDNIKLPGMK